MTNRWPPDTAGRPAPVDLWTSLRLAHQPHRFHHQQRSTHVLPTPVNLTCYRHSAGFKVYPAEVERVLAAHASVAMVAVGGQPDPLKGEVPKAYVVLRQGAEGDVDALLDHCRAHLAAYKIPRSVQFVPDLPKTSTGKIMRRQLRSLDPPEPA